MRVCAARWRPCGGQSLQPRAPWCVIQHPVPYSSSATVEHAVRVDGTRGMRRAFNRRPLSPHHPTAGRCVLDGAWQKESRRVHTNVRPSAGPRARGGAAAPPAPNASAPRPCGWAKYHCRRRAGRSGRLHPAPVLRSAPSWVWPFPGAPSRTWVGEGKSWSQVLHAQAASRAPAETRGESRHRAHRATRQGREHGTGPQKRGITGIHDPPPRATKATGQIHPHPQTHETKVRSEEGTEREKRGDGSETKKKGLQQALTDTQRRAHV